MIIHSAPQGSEEWHAARAGVITASMFSEVRKVVNGLTAQQEKYVSALKAGLPVKAALEAAEYKAKPRASVIDRALAGERVGNYTEAAECYAFRLAVERISGKPLDEGFETWAMKRGHDLEPAARFEHELAIGVVVQPAGFVTTDDRLFGASADGLIGEDGGAEYKCLVDPSRLHRVLLDGDISEFMDQVQGGMWITGRSWWDFCLYCPALERIGLQLWHRRVERDDNYIDAMEMDLIAFERLVTENETALRNFKEAA